MAKIRKKKEKQYLGSAPYGLDKNEPRDLGEPGNVLSSHEDASSKNGDLGSLLHSQLFCIRIWIWVMRFLVGNVNRFARILPNCSGYSIKRKFISRSLHRSGSWMSNENTGRASARSFNIFISFRK